MRPTAKCQRCNEDVTLPFKCQFCGQYYCPKHRLPENHDCPEYWKAITPRKDKPPITLEREPEERTYNYTITYTPPRTRIFWFSPTELKHLTIGTLLVMGVALSYVIEAPGLPMLSDLGSLMSLAVVFTLSFLLHEITHKLSAQYFGLWAEFRVTLFGALITLFSIPLPFFKIISPGAVMIAGPISRREAGKTALAGPLTNIVISAVCIAVLANTGSSFLYTISFFGAWINVIIALFNLVPFGIMDGLKVFRWNKLAWAAAFMMSMVMAILTYSML